MSVNFTIYCTLCSSLVWALGSQTQTILFTSSSFKHHVPVFNSEPVCWGSLSPCSPFQHCLFQLIWSFHHKNSDWIFVILFQKCLIIHGKVLDMHYSHPRNKYEDWLCNTVSEYIVFYNCIVWAFLLQNTTLFYIQVRYLYFFFSHTVLSVVKFLFLGWYGLLYQMRLPFSLRITAWGLY